MYKKRLALNKIQIKLLIKLDLYVLIRFIVFNKDPIINPICRNNKMGDKFLYAHDPR